LVCGSRRISEWSGDLLAFMQTTPTLPGQWFPPVYNTAGCSVAVRWAERRAEEASADNGRGHMALVEIGEKDQVTGLDGLDNEICLTVIVG
jgi:hypothetical protein